jgi:hypothetical protein
MKSGIRPTHHDHFPQSVPAVDEIMMSRIGTEGDVQTGDEHHVGGDLESMTRNRPVRLRAPRGIGENPSDWLGPIEKISSLFEFTPIGVTPGID